VEILGISFDTVADNRAFAEKFDFPYPLLCDTDKAVAVAYGAADDESAGWPNRHTYVIDPGGVIKAAIDTRDPAGQAAALIAEL